MEARIVWAGKPVVSLVLFVLLIGNTTAQAAGYRTTNFTVDAPTSQLAKEIGDTAEHWRRELAQQWLGKELPKWSKSCPIKAKVAPSLGAGGATSFVFDQGQVFGWRMNIEGSRERILDSVLPHEVLHTIFASHFRRPLPRWADEGACTTVEHRSEIAKQEHMLIKFLRDKYGIPFDAMFAMKEYPREVLPLYAQGHSLTKFLIDQRGKREFLDFLSAGMEDENWPRAIREQYGYANLLVLQNSWMDWIRQGRPKLQLAADAVLVASHEAPVIRGQNPAGSGSGTNRLAGGGVSVYNKMTSSPMTPVGPTAEQLWPVENRDAGRTQSPPGNAYDSRRLTGTVWR